MRPSSLDQIVGFRFDDGEIGRFLDRPLHGRRIELAVGLSTGTADGRALAAVQNPELDAALVGDPAHQAVQGVDLPDQMALAEPADRRVTGHRADGRKPVRDQRRRRAHARGRRRGLAAGMSATDHDDIETLIHDARYVVEGGDTVKTNGSPAVPFHVKLRSLKLLNEDFWSRIRKGKRPIYQCRSPGKSRPGCLRRPHGR